MILSNSKRTYTVGNITSKVHSKIKFKNNCIVKYDQNNIEILYKNLCDVFAILSKICPDDHWAVGGTLLGACRHGHILPWDDDGDVAVTVNGFKKISQQINLFKEQDFDIINYFCGYKIFKNEKVVCDIFVVDKKKKTNKLVYSGPYVNGRSTFITNVYFFPLIKFEIDDIFPLSKMKFGSIEINCPNKYEIILINNYSQNVLNEIILPKSTNFHNQLLCSYKICKKQYKFYLKNKEKKHLCSIFYNIFFNTMSMNSIDFMNVNILEHNIKNILETDLLGVIDDILETDLLDVIHDICN